MPPKRYSNLSVRSDVRELLDNLRAELGVSDLSDLLALLVKVYREYTSTASKVLEEISLIREQIESVSSKLDQLSKATSNPSPTPSSGSSKSSSKSTKSGTKEGSEYVKMFTIEWASRKGLNVEEYMKGKESQGYICNDTASHVICVWREELEQAVVDLNNAKARMGELGKVLSGVRLEVARVAEKAGLLWFDAREGRWKIH